MFTIIKFISIINIISCLEMKYSLKTESFLSNCESIHTKISFQKLKKECIIEDYDYKNCKDIEGQSY